MARYKVESNGSAPAGLNPGDEVVTAGGTYKITGVNADGSYKSELVNKNQTTYNYAGSYAPTSGRISGVSDGTYQKLAGYERGYSPSDAVLQAESYLKGLSGNRPGNYVSKWDDELESIYQKIMNREPFSYDLNADMLYQQYKDQYQSLGQMAMMDTMGQAAALTGGYGNTYAQNAGQQAYNAYLRNLNDVVPELYSMAYEKYRDEGTDLYNQFGMTQGLDERDYGRYRDTVSDWYNDVGLAMDYYNSQYDRDYQQWATMLDYYSNKAAMENSDYWTRTQYEDSRAKAASGGGGGRSTEPEVEFGPGMDAIMYDRFRSSLGTYLKSGQFAKTEQLLDKYAGMLNENQMKEIMNLYESYIKK